MPEIISFLERQKIDALISDVAERISADYRGKELVLIGILNGAFVFLADLIRKLTVPVEIDFIGTSSYGSDVASCGRVCMTKELSVDVEDKHVLIVEDIIDTGLTLGYVMDYLRSHRPKTLKVCTLLDKKERRTADLKIDYVCQEVGKGFVVGYGLDYAGKYRQLPEICFLKSEK